MNVMKMNGELEPVDHNKINKQLHYACDGLKASASLIAARAQIKITDGMRTSTIQDILIETAKGLITIETPDYSIVSSRLMVHKLRKQAYGRYTPPKILDHISKCIDLGKYDSELLNKYTTQEFDEIDNAINHDLDNALHLAAMNQFIGKYIMRTSKDDESSVIESPQMCYMMIALTLHDTVEEVIETYHEFAHQHISLPTPIMAGVRSPSRQFSSCVLVDSDDSLKSITHTSANIVDYVSNRAGIGINMGRIRGSGSKIGNGEKRHTGILPFLKLQVAALKSCSQGGVRGGSATSYFPMWHIEIENILSWKNNRGTEETRERRCDYGIQINDSMIKRALNKQDIYLFDPHSDLYEAYFKTEEEFEERYNHYITLYKAGLVRGAIISANDLFTQFIDSRFETGRYYPFFVNNVNDLSTFGSSYPIYMSNLCLEITLPTKPAESEYDKEGLISLCTLMSINMSKFLTIDDLKTKLPKTISVAIRTLDKLLSYQDYMSPHAKRATDLFRTLGIGVVNLADFLAQHRCRYGSKKALNLVNEFWAAMYYHGKKTSIELAKELGPCGASDVLEPFNHLKHDAKFNLVEKLGLSPTKIEYDFDGLQALYEEHGIRNATLFAVAPTETSSQLLNATNGVEMPRNAITIKGSKDSVGSAQVIPSPELVDEYDYLWDQKCPINYITTVAVCGRWCDQSISTNTPYNPNNFEGRKIPRSKLLDDLLLGWSLGLKTFYYNVVNDNASDKRELLQPLPNEVITAEEDDDPCGGACTI